MGRIMMFECRDALLQVSGVGCFTVNAYPLGELIYEVEESM